MCLQWAKHPQFDETRCARWSWVIFQQAHKVVSGNCNHEATFCHLTVLPSSTSLHFVTIELCCKVFQQHLKILHLRVRISSPSIFTIFQRHLKVFHFASSRFVTFVPCHLLAVFECLASTSSCFVTIKPPHPLAAFYGLSSLSSHFVTFEPHHLLAAFECLATTRLHNFSSPLSLHRNLIQYCVIACCQIYR